MIGILGLVNFMPLRRSTSRKFWTHLLLLMLLTLWSQEGVEAEMSLRYS